MRTRFAPAATFAGIFALGAVASPQSPAKPPSRAWDVIVTVRKDRVGADLVSFGARRSDYPPDLLREQIGKVGSDVRGLSVVREEIRPGEASSAVVRGSCAVDGLIEASGALNIAPIARAFAGAPEPYTVHRMLVSFDGVPVVPGKTMAYHTAGPGSDLVFSGRLVGSSVEYEVELRSQDPARLVVNETVAPVASASGAVAKSGYDAATVALFALAALAAGALVYCLLILVGRRTVVKS